MIHGGFDLNSAEGARFEVEHTKLTRELLPLWQKLDEAKQQGTLSSRISLRLIENPAREQREWLTQVKASAGDPIAMKIEMARQEAEQPRIPPSTRDR